MIFDYRINKVKTLSKIITLIIILCLFSNGNLITVSENSSKKNSLGEKFKNYFFVGAAINRDQILQNDKKSISIIKRNFNTLSPENVMKWMFIQPKPNTFYFDDSDKYVQFGLDNNMHIVGHALIWHSQIADFMNSIKDSTEMMQHVNN